MSNIKNLLIVTEESTRVVRESFEKTEEEISELLAELKHWLKNSQEEIPCDILVEDEQRLLNLLIRNKFRLEKTKKKLQYYYKFRKSNRSYFDPEYLNPKSDHMINVIKLTNFSLLPNLTPSGERVVFFRLKDQSDFPAFLPLAAFSMYQLSLATSHDFSKADRIVVDLEGFQFKFWISIDPMSLYRCLYLYKDGFSARIAGFHYINAPYFIHLVIMVLRTVIKDCKFYVHKTLEDLFEHVPKESLPEEYGGEQGNSEDVQKKWVEELEYQLDWVNENFKKDKV